MHLEKTKKIVVIWTIGLAGKFVLALLILFKRLTLYGYRREKLSCRDRGLLVLCNHPSLWEPFLLIFLFTSFKCLFSLRDVPYVLVDKENFYDKRWFWLFRPFVIEVDRKKLRRMSRTSEKLRSVIKEGGTVILFPEGGRTDNWVRRRGIRYSFSGKYIARFPLGLRKLFSDMDFCILPNWSEGGERVILNEALPSKELVSGEANSFRKKIRRVAAWIPRIWRKTTITMGEPLSPRDIPEDKMVGWLEDALLSAADSKPEHIR